MAEVPDVYCDQFTMAQSQYGIAFTFLLSPSSPISLLQAQGEPQAVVRMSLEHAKVLAMMIRKNLKQFELEHLGDPIKLPMDAYQKLGLSPEDW